MSWVARNPVKYWPSGSPALVAAKLGVDRSELVDAEGNATSNVHTVWKPDLSAVEGFKTKYWKVAAYPDDTVSLMTQAERDAVDAANLEQARENAAKQLDQQEDILRAFMLLVLDQVNELRADHGRGAFTATQLRNAIKNKLGQ